ncbi:cysteine desulfurase family protein [uncultured Flavobacterium sp.]|uniref:cysteine desulfurase family protein n=1 Tax=uncultured Flavobacterium sp. TaxID=165435 RepID=UPI0025EEE620|nr:cysteine desulfurase family protein [uncultured Flavobacterium sp.]
MNYPIYLDNNATTSCDKRVVAEMLPYFSEDFGNASSGNHIFGWKAEEAVETARNQIAKLINASPHEIVFTSGATEANNLALKGIFESYSNKGNHIITTNIEHKSVLDTCRSLEKKGAEVTYLKVDKEGMIDLEVLEKSIKPTTILIAIMFANNEIGTIHPIEIIGKIAKKYDVLFFSDAVQAVGKIAVDVKKQGIDLMSLTAHKFHGPKGIGALYIRKGNPSVAILPQIIGGGHERNLRSGTLNVPGIAGFGKACEICLSEIDANYEKMVYLRNYLEDELLKIDSVFINGNISNRLPNVSNLTFKNIDGERLLRMVNKEIAVSSGSACSSVSQKPSYVLKALGISDDDAFSSIRFGFSRFTTESEIERAIKIVAKTVEKLTN